MLSRIPRSAKHSQPASTSAPASARPGKRLPFLSGENLPYTHPALTGSLPASGGAEIRRVIFVFAPPPLSRPPHPPPHAPPCPHLPATTTTRRVLSSPAPPRPPRPTARSPPARHKQHAQTRQNRPRSTTSRAPTLHGFSLVSGAPSSLGPWTVCAPRLPPLCARLLTSDLSSPVPSSRRRLCADATGTIVATLLSPIGSYFNESNRSSYIGTSYLLSVCCFTPLYGARLLIVLLFRDMTTSPHQVVSLTSSAAKARCFSRSPSSVRPLSPRGSHTSLTDATAGSGTLLCGLAPSMDALIAARALAGMGGGG